MISLQVSTTIVRRSIDTVNERHACDHRTTSTTALRSEHCFEQARSRTENDHSRQWQPSLGVARTIRKRQQRIARSQRCQCSASRWRRATGNARSMDQRHAAALVGVRGVRCRDHGLSSGLLLHRSLLLVTSKPQYRSSHDPGHEKHHCTIVDHETSDRCMRID